MLKLAATLAISTSPMRGHQRGRGMRFKTLAIMAVGLIWIAHSEPAASQSCTSTTLDNYIAAGGNGCTLNGLVISNVGYSGSANAPAANSLLVSPTSFFISDNSPGNVGGYAFNVSGNNSVTFTTSMDVSGPTNGIQQLYSGFEADWNANSSASLSVTEDICVGGAFANTTCTGQLFANSSSWSMTPGGLQTPSGLEPFGVGCSPAPTPCIFSSGIVPAGLSGIGSFTDAAIQTTYTLSAGGGNAGMVAFNVINSNVPPVAAPEMDPSAASCLVLLLGSLAVLRGRRTTMEGPHRSRR